MYIPLLMLAVKYSSLLGFTLFVASLTVPQLLLVYDDEVVDSLTILLLLLALQ